MSGKREVRDKKPPEHPGEDDDRQRAEQLTHSTLERIAAAPTLDGKVSALLEALDWMMRWPTQVDTEGAQPGQLTRNQRIFADAAFGMFLSALKRPDLADFFRALTYTLSDLDFGIVDNSLEKISRRGGPTPYSSEVWRGRAQVAAALDTYYRADIPIKKGKDTIDAHQELLPLVDEDKRGREHALGDAAEGWREEFNGGRVDNFLATNTYKQCQAIAAMYDSADELKKYAELLLRQAATTASKVERDSG